MKALLGRILVVGLGLLAAGLQAQPVITNQPAGLLVVAGGNATFSVLATGTGPFTYQWQLNGTNLPNNIITTVAGNGVTNFMGDGGLATNAGLDAPQGVAFDAAGNYYIADYGNRVRKVDTNGIITTVAGNGVGAGVGATGSYSGDGGAATNAGLFIPNNVVLDSTGNLFIADFSNCRIRKVDTNDIITTIAGNGGFTSSGDGGAATNASIGWPSCVAFDATGDLFIADYHNSRIRKVDTSGNISTVTNFSQPQGVATDVAGNLYVAAGGAQRVYKVATNGVIATVAGGGTGGEGGAATNAALVSPWSVVLDPFGNWFIADNGRYEIFKVDTNGIITKIAGIGIRGFAGDGGAANNAILKFPTCVALDTAGNLFIADSGNNRIRKILTTVNPMLTLNNVSFTNAGNYSVIITNSSGSVTSSVASLTVVLPGYNHVAGQVLGDGTMQLAFVGIAGGNYALDSTVSLSPANWIPQATNRADANGNLIFTNAPDPTTNDFWRIRSVP
jgi:sugar lactone lactonase YvrE